MKEVKLMIDTDGFDHIQAKLEEITKKLDAENRDVLITAIDRHLEDLIDTILKNIRTAVRSELKDLIEKEFAKLGMKVLNK